MGREHWKKIWVGSAGNMVEWFDWFVYATFAVYFADAFFPKGNETANLMNTMGIFAVGFFMRPVGGWLLGRIGDRKGRKAALTLTVTLMSASAILIAIAPTYAVAGYGEWPFSSSPGSSRGSPSAASTPPAPPTSPRPPTPGGAASPPASSTCR